MSLTLTPSPFAADLQPLPVPIDLGATSRGEDQAPAETREAEAALAGGNPAEVMQRLSDGDPVGIRRRIRRRLAYQAVLLDPTRLRWRALAYCAMTAGERNPHERLGVFLDRALDEAMASLIGEDWQADREGDPATAASSPFRQVAAGVGLRPERARRIALEFNLLDRKQRRPLYRILVEGAAPDEVAYAFGMQPDELARRLNELLDRMGTN